MTRLLLKVVRPLVPFVLASVCVECAGGDYSIGGENAGGTQAAGEGGSAGRTAGSGDGSSGERNGATGGEGTLAEPAGGTGGQPLSGASGGEADDGGSEGNNGGTGPGSGGAGDGGAGCTPRVLTRCLRPSFPLGGQDPSLETPARVALEGVSALNAVNSRDQMVGAGPMGCGGTRALMFEDGNALSLLAELDHTYSEALDINDHGTVVGQVSFDVTPDPAEMVPFVWSDGVTLLLSQERGLRPVAVNDHDQVLLLPEAPALGGFLWEDGALTDLAIAAEPHGVTPHGMNNLGQVVGDLITESGVSGFLWEEGSIQELADFSSIRAINDAGQMAGFSRSRQAALWDGATLLLLGGPPGPREFDAPVAITAEGAVLGDSYVYSQGVLSPLTGRVDGVNIVWPGARDMNDNHLIVGEATTMVFVRGVGSCRNESCEGPQEEHRVIWSQSCVGTCCGQGEGGAGGAGGAGEEARCDASPVTSVPMVCPQPSKPPERAYEPTALGFLDAVGPDFDPLGPWSQAGGINATGQVTGSSSHCEESHAFLFSGGVMRDLGTPGITSHGNAINDQGVVVGMSSARPALWKQGELALLSGLESGRATAINNLEQIVGSAGNQGFIWQSGAVVARFSAFSSAEDINNLGQVVGSAHYEGEQRAFLWQAGVMTYLPHLFGIASEAFAINDHGQVVGRSYDLTGRGRAVLWDQGVAVDITPPTDFDFVGAVALDINEAGVVIGSYQEDGPRQNSLGYVYDHGSFVRLEGSVAGEFHSLQGVSINARGEIAGSTLHATGAPDQARVWSTACFDACCQQGGR